MHAQVLITCIKASAALHLLVMSCSLLLLQVWILDICGGGHSVWRVGVWGSFLAQMSTSFVLSKTKEK